MLDQKRDEERFAVLHKFTNCLLHHILCCWCVFFFSNLPSDSEGHYACRIHACCKYWLRENQSVLLNVPLGVLVLKGTVKLFA